MEYTLSDFGNSFMDVLAYMKTWGDQNLPDEAVSRVCSDPTSVNEETRRTVVEEPGFRPNAKHLKLQNSTGSFIFPRIQKKELTNPRE